MTKKSSKKPAASPPVSKPAEPPLAKPLRLEYVEAGSLTPNPLNWRRHPEHQMAAIHDVLKDKDIGWAGALLFNERTGRLLDGHARQKSVDPAELVPVLVGSWSEEAEKKILATLDPIAGMAEADLDALTDLVDGLEFDSDALAAMTSELIHDMGEDDEEPEPSTAPEAGTDDGSAKPQLGGLEYRVIVECKSERHQAKLLRRFGKEGLSCRALIS